MDKEDSRIKKIDSTSHMRDMKYRLRDHTLSHTTYFGKKVDESKVSVLVTGHIFDNTHEENPVASSAGRLHEFSVGVTVNGRREWFNLATLFALARTSKLKAESYYGHINEREQEQKIACLTCDWHGQEWDLESGSDDPLDIDFIYCPSCHGSDFRNVAA